MFQLTARPEPVVDSAKYTAADVRIVSRNLHFYHLISDIMKYQDSFLVEDLKIHNCYVFI